MTNIRLQNCNFCN